MKPILFDVARLEPGSVPMLVTSPDLSACDDLPAAVTPSGQTVSLWTFTEAERQAISAGADVFAFQFNGGRPLQPLALLVVTEHGPV